MIAVQVGRLEDQRVAVFSQDHAVDRCSFANYANIPGDGERRKLLVKTGSSNQSTFISFSFEIPHFRDKKCLSVMLGR